ncbi:hypothetical protein ES288_A05G243700v1 [Gossypium darwinii]|uniref:Uncharacterized protein n=1 Tax=Gossypium darwinii TaxID=34276 RepID=A0A5D2GJ38_GOSDA|nr:hypothetical protein ES288_A05G243700v1 [Gossypium darwinii]TYH18113.1 hypothetical protein ES288_A05G243700v1 [Gossypium darwinii]
MKVKWFVNSKRKQKGNLINLPSQIDSWPFSQFPRESINFSYYLFQTIINLHFLSIRFSRPPFLQSLASKFWKFSYQTCWSKAASKEIVTSDLLLSCIAPSVD